MSSEDIPWESGEESHPMDMRLSEKPLPVMANKTKLEAIVGRPLPEELFHFTPWGRRLVVVRENPVEMHKGIIYIPKQAQERPAVGWVASCGQDVGPSYASLGPTVGTSPFDARQLLGVKVLFGAYAGDALLIGDTGDNDLFQSEFVMLTDADLWGHLWPLPEEPPV